jgi:hypothetical protein
MKKALKADMSCSVVEDAALRRSVGGVLARMAAHSRLGDFDRLWPLGFGLYRSIALWC